MLDELMGGDDAPRPQLPDNLPDSVKQIASEAIDTLIEYQSPGYAQLYADRLRRFVGRNNVDDGMLGEIARLMMLRMSYDDAIRMAQVKLAEAGTPESSSDDIRKLRLDELVGALPEMVADPLLGGLEWLGWLHKPVTMRFSSASRWSVRRLKIEASARRWRLLSVRYAKERVWVERWLHMIDRSLTKQPKAVFEVVQTARLIEGYGDSYRKGLADWNLIIDSLAKPAFDGVLVLPDLTAALAQARATALHDAQGVELRKVITRIRSQAPVPGPKISAG